MKTLAEFGTWAVRSWRVWFVRPLGFALGVALAVILAGVAGAGSDAPPDPPAAPGIAPFLVAFVGPIVSGLIAGAMTGAAMLFRQDRRQAVLEERVNGLGERHDGTASRVGRLEEWKDRHLEGHQ